MLDIDRLDYDKAITKLLEHRMISDENANVCYLLGISYLYSDNRPRSKEKASFYLRKAAKNVDTAYEFWILDETAAPPETYYHLGKAEEQLQNYEQAAIAFEDYLTILDENQKLSGGRMYALIKRTAIEFQTASQNQSRSDQPTELQLARSKY